MRWNAQQFWKNLNDDKAISMLEQNHLELESGTYNCRNWNKYFCGLFLILVSAWLSVRLL